LFEIQYYFLVAPRLTRDKEAALSAHPESVTQWSRWMILKQLYIKDFRCFEEKNLSLASSLILIEGSNGSGKSTLLEALHYLCYLRSFRTHTPRELLRFGQDTFFLKAVFETDDHGITESHEIQVGFSGKKRLVKINQKPVSSFKELMNFYRIVTLTEDDLNLIKGSPEVRRAFIDQAIVLHDPNFSSKLRAFKTITDNRNKLLQGRSVDRHYYDILTEQLWTASVEIQQRRQVILKELERDVNTMAEAYFAGDFKIELAYKQKRTKSGQDFGAFIEVNPDLYEEETRFRRSFFGAHLDDFAISLREKASKSFASRGQQKLVTLLIKVAQIKELTLQKGPVVFLLDDFMADFDESNAQILFSVLMALKSQLIFTTPTQSGQFNEKVLSVGGQKISLTC